VIEYGLKLFWREWRVRYYREHEAFVGNIYIILTFYKFKRRC